MKNAANLNRMAEAEMSREMRRMEEKLKGHEEHHAGMWFGEFRCWTCEARKEDQNG